MYRFKEPEEPKALWICEWCRDGIYEDDWMEVIERDDEDHIIHPECFSDYAHYLLQPRTMIATKNQEELYL